MVGTMVEDIDFAICTNGTAADNNQTNNAMDEYDRKSSEKILY